MGRCETEHAKDGTETWPFWLNYIDTLDSETPYDDDANLFAQRS